MPLQNPISIEQTSIPTAPRLHTNISQNAPIKHTASTSQCPYPSPAHKHHSQHNTEVYILTCKPPVRPLKRHEAARGACPSQLHCNATGIHDRASRRRKRASEHSYVGPSCSCMIVELTLGDYWRDEANSWCLDAGAAWVRHGGGFLMLRNLTSVEEEKFAGIVFGREDCFVACG